MNLDPSPDHIVIGFYTDGSLPPFVISCLNMALQMLEADVFDFDLKRAVLARGLLVPAEVRGLLDAGKALVAAARAHEDDAEEEAANEEPRANGILPAEGEDHIDEAEAAAETRPLWRLTLPEVLTITTAADFAATAYLTSFGEEARAVQLQQGMPAEEYDARLLETLGYFGRFQREWSEIFADYPAFQAHLEVLAAVREEFVA
jgi:hypothetical protein